MTHIRKPRPTTRTTYTPTAVNPFDRLHLFDAAMVGVNRIAAEEQEA